jgi:hypothetical protein
MTMPSSEREPLDQAFQVICSASMKAALSEAVDRYGVSLAVLVRECVTYALPAVKAAHELVHSGAGSAGVERVA